jgi:cytochrome c
LSAGVAAGVEVRTSGKLPLEYGSDGEGSLPRWREQENVTVQQSIGRLWIFAAVATLLGGTALVAGSANATGDASRGAELYQGCEDCHSIDKNDVGPMHKGVVGRAAGSVPGYNYSHALKTSKIIWTEENLDKWLTNPSKLVPGTKMFYAVQDAQDRADIIAFLKERAR